MSLFDIFNASKIKSENESLKKEIASMQSRIDALGVSEYEQTISKISAIESESNNRLQQVNADIESNKSILSKLQEQLADLQAKEEKVSKSLSTQEKKLSRSKELYKSIDYSIKYFFDTDAPYESCKLPQSDLDDLEQISPSVILKLHCMDVKSLRQAYRDNDKQINKLLSQYSSRYTTKANKTIYDLMVIALRCELQNILYNLKYEKN